MKMVLNKIDAFLWHLRNRWGLLAGLFLYFLVSKTNQQFIIGKWQASDEAHKDWSFEFAWEPDGTKDVGPVTFTTKDKKYDGAYTTLNRASGVGTIFGRKEQNERDYDY